MRPLELILLLALGVATASRIHRGTDAALPPTAWAIAILVLTLHLTQEGWRWQMIPAYVLCAILGLALLKAPPPLRVIWVAVAAILLGTAAALASLFPVFRMPQRDSGSTAGTATLLLIDDIGPPPVGRRPGAGQARNS